MFTVVLLFLSSVLCCTWHVEAMSCEDARMKCAYRTGCGSALQKYVLGCSGLRDTPNYCPEECQHALIALTSTPEGQDLMTCECGDDYCNETKMSVEVCRPYVLRATSNETVVTCVVAQWICGADTLCSTALKFYHKFCRSMFLGKKCSRRCKNSIDILRKQEKAAKLDSCVCNGREDFDCLSIRRNMERMCFHREPPPLPPIDEEDILTNEVSVMGGVGATRGFASVLHPSSSFVFFGCFIISLLNCR